MKRIVLNTLIVLSLVIVFCNCGKRVYVEDRINSIRIEYKERIATFGISTHDRLVELGRTYIVLDSNKYDLDEERRILTNKLFESNFSDLCSFYEEKGMIRCKDCPPNYNISILYESGKRKTVSGFDYYPPEIRDIFNFNFHLTFHLNQEFPEIDITEYPKYFRYSEGIEKYNSNLIICY